MIIFIYIASVVLFSAILVISILSRKDRNQWSLDEESEELINNNKQLKR